MPAISLQAFGDLEEQAKNPPTPTPARQRYESKGGYSIEVPPGWEKSSDTLGPIDAAFFCGEDPGVNISIMWGAAGKDEKLDEKQADEMKELFKGRYDNYAVTAEEWAEIAGVRAYCLSSRFEQAGVGLQNKQVMLIKKDKFYILTYTATPDLFMKRLGEFEKALSSFKTN